MMLKVLLNRYHEKKIKDFIALLPAEDGQAIAKIPIDFNEPEAILWNFDKKVGLIHYSWYAPIFKKIPVHEASWMLQVLPQRSAVKLQQVCQIPFTGVKLSPFARAFASHYLWKQIEDPAILPLEFVPQTPLSVLMQFSREQLLEIIDLLGVYDLTEKVRHIVDKNRLKSIYSSLKPRELQFLHHCLNQQAKIVVSPLKLNDWDGTAQSLRRKLHRRGLSRLGYSVKEESPHFLWYFLRKFDIGRAALLQHCFDKEEITQKVRGELIQQLLNLVNFRNKKETREQ
ncbi:MAG: hypothetical protein CK425_03625 [Parachlamydia sp.]|nr:MAG: hypothetical protein CK425_03625 [Parachlamydia sp.]